MRKIKGTIVSNKMNKTVVVKVDYLKKHPKYFKYYRFSKKFKAHDEKGEYKEGDVVIIEETKPVSKEKRWRVVSLVVRPEVMAGEESGSTKAENELAIKE